MPRRPALADALTHLADALADAITGHRNHQLDRIETTLTRLEDHMSNLDDAVTAIADAVTTEVDDLRAKLIQAQADDTAAADVAADVEENVSKLEALASGLRDGSFPAAPEQPADPGTDTPPVVA